MPKNQIHRILAPSNEVGISEPGQSYLWGFQTHQQSSLQWSAKQLFERLIPGIDPKFAYVAIRVDDTNNPAAIVEPMNDIFEASDFAETTNLHSLILKLKTPIIYAHSEGDPHGPQYVKRGMDAQSQANLVQSVRETIGYRCIHDDLEPFVSDPITVGCYALFSVLLLKRSIIQTYRNINHRPQVRYASTLSFIDAIANGFIAHATNITRTSIDTKYLVPVSNDDEILSAAANDFLRTPFTYVGDFMMSHGAEVFDSLSTLTYEKQTAIGEIILAAFDHRNIEVSLTLSNPVDIHDYRTVRKLLQLVGRGEGLLYERRGIYGVGKIVGDYDTSRADLFRVRILEQFKWELVHQNTVLIRSEFGKPFVYRNIDQLDQFVELFQRIFAPSDTSLTHRTRLIATWASKLDCGTILVIHRNAVTETERFSSQAIRINPVPITQELIQKASRIDGAILLDETGICYAIGVILDGLATHLGRKERGSRFNSAVRYVASQTAPCLAMIVSDDGMIDVVPEFVHQLSKRLLDEKLKDAERLSAEQTVDATEYNKLLTWFKEHAKYLQNTHCKLLNKLFPQIESKCPRTSNRHLFSNFSPNKEIDDSFYTD